MGISTPPVVPGSEAPAATSVPAVVPAPATPAPSPIRVAAEAARALIKAEEAKGKAVQTPAALVAKPEETPKPVAGAPVVAPVAAAAALTAEEIAQEDAAAEAEEARLAATETAEQTAARHAAESAATAAALAAAGTAFQPVAIELPGSHEGEVIAIEFGDQESVDAINRLKRGYARREEAEAIRDAGQKLRDDAEDIHYAAELDPANILVSAIKTTGDVDHLFRFLATRAGVLERNREWATTLLDQPEAIAGEASKADAERITRREAVKPLVAEKMAFDENARSVLKAMNKSLTAMVPESFTEESLALLDRDIRQDMFAVVRRQVEQYMREQGITRDARGRPTQPIPVAVRMFDPRQMPKLIERRFQLLGVTPRKPGAAAPQVKAGASETLPSGEPKTRPAGKTPLTPEALKAARAARAAAASAPPGAGSPVVTMPKAPPFDPKGKGSPIQQAAAHARAFIARVSKRPQ